MKSADSISIKRRGRKRVSVALSESKTLVLFQEGRRLLAGADFEDVSIAQFAKAASTSVGAFYVRFANKDAFLDFVTSNTFNSARRSFDSSLSSIASHKNPAVALSDVIVSQLAAKELAGIVRLAVKRGLSDIERRRAFDVYRTHLADKVINSLPEDTHNKNKTEIAFAIRSVFGILTDAITSTPLTKPLKLYEYHDTVVHLLSKPFGNLKLEQPITEEVVEQSVVKKI